MAACSTFNGKDIGLRCCSSCSGPCDNDCASRGRFPPLSSGWLERDADEDERDAAVLPAPAAQRRLDAPGMLVQL